ncbi:hypothetical protein CSQ90_19205 [Janthinobacterium sp. BJB303]|nr:hypothetical protein CSQ90_19205 [Janthinobacterium sp. BJB303]
MTTPCHRIDAVHLDLTFESDAPRLLPMADDALLALTRELVLPALSQALDEADEPGRRRRIGRLDIDLGQIPAHLLASEMPRRLRELLGNALRDALREAAPATSAAAVPAPAGDAAAANAMSGDSRRLLHFLRTGDMAIARAEAGPGAGARHGGPDQLLARLLDDRGATWPAMLRQAAGEPGVLARLAQQFSPAQLRRLVRHAAARGAADAWLELIDGICAALPAGTADGRMQRRQAWHVVLSQVLGGSAPAAGAALRAAAAAVHLEARHARSEAAALLRALAGNAAPRPAAMVAPHQLPLAPDAPALPAAPFHLPATRRPAALRAWLQALRQAPARFIASRYSAQQLQQLLDAFPGLRGDTLAAIAMRLPRARDRQRYLGLALDRLLRDPPETRPHGTASAGQPPVTTAATAQGPNALRERLARALASADPSMVQADWPALRREHAALLRAALCSHGGERAAWQRIASHFPPAMLDDMAAVLAGPGAWPLTPPAGAAWHAARRARWLATVLRGVAAAAASGAGLPLAPGMAQVQEEAGKTPQHGSASQRFMHGLLDDFQRGRAAGVDAPDTQAPGTQDRSDGGAAAATEPATADAGERLASALSTADASAIYADWDALLRGAAAQLRAALLEHGAASPAWPAVASRFPASMLDDIAALLDVPCRAASEADTRAGWLDAVLATLASRAAAGAVHDRAPEPAESAPARVPATRPSEAWNDIVRLAQAAGAGLGDGSASQLLQAVRTRAAASGSPARFLALVRVELAAARQIDLDAIAQRTSDACVALFMRALAHGDAAALLPEWPALRAACAGQLADAMRRIGPRESVWRRVSQRFPPAMLDELTALLAPPAQAMPQAQAAPHAGRDAAMRRRWLASILELAAHPGDAAAARTALPAAATARAMEEQDAGQAPAPRPGDGRSRVMPGRRRLLLAALRARPSAADGAAARATRAMESRDVHAAPGPAAGAAAGMAACAPASDLAPAPELAEAWSDIGRRVAAAAAGTGASQLLQAVRTRAAASGSPARFLALVRVELAAARQIDLDAIAQRTSDACVALFMRALAHGDAAALLPEWPALRAACAGQLADAMRRIGPRESVWRRVSQRFPHAMLDELTALLAPQAQAMPQAQAAPHAGRDAAMRRRWLASILELAAHPGDATASGTARLAATAPHEAPEAQAGQEAQGVQEAQEADAVPVPVEHIVSALLAADHASLSPAMLANNKAAARAAIGRIGLRPDVWRDVARRYPRPLLQALAAVLAPDGGAASALAALAAPGAMKAAAPAAGGAAMPAPHAPWRRQWLARITRRIAADAGAASRGAAPGQHALPPGAPPAAAPPAGMGTAVPSFAMRDSGVSGAAILPRRLSRDEPPRLTRAAQAAQRRARMDSMAQALLRADAPALAPLVLAGPPGLLREAARHIGADNGTWRRAAAAFAPSLRAALTAAMAPQAAALADAWLAEGAGRADDEARRLWRRSMSYLAGLPPGAPFDPAAYAHVLQAARASEGASSDAGAAARHARIAPALAHAADMASLSGQTDKAGLAHASPASPAAARLLQRIERQIGQQTGRHAGARAATGIMSAQPAGAVMLQAIAARAARSASPESFLQAALDTLRLGAVLDLDAVAAQAGAAATASPAAPGTPGTQAAPAPALVATATGGRAPAAMQGVRRQIAARLAAGAPAQERHAGTLLAAVDAHAARSAAPAAYLRQVLDALEAGRVIDLDALDARHAPPQQPQTGAAAITGQPDAATPARPPEARPVPAHAPPEPARHREPRAQLPANPPAGPLHRPLGSELARALGRHAPAQRAALARLLQLAAGDDDSDGTPVAAENAAARPLPPALLHGVVELQAGDARQAQARHARDVADLAAACLPGASLQQCTLQALQFDFDWFFGQGRPFSAAPYAYALASHLAQPHGDAAVARLHAALHARLGIAPPQPTLAQHEGASAAAPRTVPAEGETLYLANAGLVLIGPYMPRLFSMLGLTEGARFRNAEAAERAVHLLQYVVDGQCDQPEYLLGLNKVLCGVSASVPVVREIIATEEERATIEMMLRAMIEHWKKIGNTSPDGLRQAFLQRPGSMHLHEDAWRLSVEAGAFDMLLDTLPWSFSIIKHPWMERAVHVNWR